MELFAQKICEKLTKDLKTRTQQEKKHCKIREDERKKKEEQEKKKQKEMRWDLLSQEELERGIALAPQGIFLTSDKMNQKRRSNSRQMV